MDELRRRLSRIDGRGYRAYQDLRGEYVAETFRLFIDHVQGDPFASPSRIALVVDAPDAGLPAEFWNTSVRRIATEDYLTRRVADVLPRVCRGGRGSGKSGRVDIDTPGQEVLERTCCLIDDGGIEVRLTVGLPAAGRRVLAREAEAIFCRELPALVAAALLAGAHDLGRMRAHANAVDDQHALRAQLRERGLVAFVAEGARLARHSGIDDRPLRDSVPFGPVPDSMRVVLECPHAGHVTGLGIPCGVTLIVGGGYHGKSTLLDAIARGIYDHVPGDGRHQVVTDRHALTVRAEDGRRVDHVRIRPFIGPLPNGTSSEDFCTERASGSTSQAAAVIEGVEAGATALLIDEDTSASNFLSRDARMQALVAPDAEPIRPLIDQVKTLHAAHGVSTIIVVGGSGDWFDVADYALQMADYRPTDVTARMRAICDQHPTRRIPSTESEFVVVNRVIERAGLDPRGRRGRQRVKTRATRSILYGDEEIDVSLLNQLVSSSQTRAVADALVWLWEQLAGGPMTIREACAALTDILETDGLCGVAQRRSLDRAGIRALDVACALNRHRRLQTTIVADENDGTKETP